MLVVGMNRSGTKWLSNELMRHDAIAAVADDRHYGILESNMFGTFDTKFDLSLRDEYLGLIELWSRTDFFRHTGVDEAYFRRLDPHPTCCAELFDRLMTRYARREHAGVWLQKTNPSGLWRTREYFRDASIVFIKRNLIDNIRSRIGSALLDDRRPSLIRAVALYVLQEKLLERLYDEEKHCFISFESLRDDVDRQRRAVFEAVGLDPERLQPPFEFERNSSFSGSLDRDEVLSASDERRIRRWAALFRAMPLEVLQRLRDIVARHPRPFVSGTFSNLEHDDEDVGSSSDGDGS
jgi:hypothetical protein